MHVTRRRVEPREQSPKGLDGVVGRPVPWPLPRGRAESRPTITAVTAGVPELVTLHVWRVPTPAVPVALLRMARDGRLLARTAGVRFAKMVGVSQGRTFLPRDADPSHWGLVAAWETTQAAAAFEQTPVARKWNDLSRERLRVSMRVVSSRGRWSRRYPFGEPRPAAHAGPVAVLTRARLKPTKAATFWRASPPVAADLSRSRGLRLALAIGEAPVLLQGTFSLWESVDAMTDFAYHRASHVEVVRRTPAIGWYAEELFARFAVVSVEGSFRGSTP